LRDEKIAEQLRAARDESAQRALLTSPAAAA
jgi:hypothetical protein